MIRSALEKAAAIGTWLMASSFVIGYLIPPLAAACKGLILPAILIILTVAMLRLDVAKLRGYIHRPGAMTLIVLINLIAAPILVWFILGPIDMPEGLRQGMVLLAAAPMVSSAIAFATILELDSALAVAVMEQRGFGSEDFLKNHPGGKLGAQLSRVADLMHKGEKVPTVEADTPMSDVLLSMTSKGFGITGVLKGGILIGVISDGDLRRHMGNLMEKTAGEIATLDPVTITPELFAAQALALLNEKKISALMVVDEAKRPVGIVHIHDLLRAGVA